MHTIALQANCHIPATGPIKLMQTPIRLLAQPKSMRSIIDPTQREQRHGLV